MANFNLNNVKINQNFKLVSFEQILVNLDVTRKRFRFYCK